MQLHMGGLHEKIDVDNGNNQEVSISTLFKRSPRFSSMQLSRASSYSHSYIFLLWINGDQANDTIISHPDFVMQRAYQICFLSCVCSVFI